MGLKDLSVRKFLRLFFTGIIMIAVILLLVLFWMTRDIRVVGYGLLLTVILFAWVAIFLHYFEKITK